MDGRKQKRKWSSANVQKKRKQVREAAAHASRPHLVIHFAPDQLEDQVDDAHVEWDEGKLSIGGYNIHSDNCDVSVYVGGKAKLHLHRKGNGTPEPRKSNAALHDAVQVLAVHASLAAHGH